MWLIVGLGNPGNKYRFTRHNIGFLSIEDFVIKHHSDTLPAPKSEHKAHTWKIRLGTEEVLIAQPQTYMNLSGESVGALLHYYKIPVEQLLVVHDEVDIPFQRLKFQKNRGAAGHNGIKNITQVLGTQDYCRLKLGVGKPLVAGVPIVDYVLQNFLEDEMKEMAHYLDKATEGVESFITNGFEKTSSTFNQKMEK